MLIAEETVWGNGSAFWTLLTHGLDSYDFGDPLAVLSLHTVNHSELFLRQSWFQGSWQPLAPHAAEIALTPLR